MEVVNELKLKREELDKGLEAAGSNHRYQFILLFSLFFLKIVTDSFYCPLPYFLMDPKINCLDDSTNLYTKQCNLNEVCEYNSKITHNTPNKLIFYKLDKSTSNSYSFITQYRLDCNYLHIGFLVSAASIGNLLANIIGPILTENIGRKSTLTVTLFFDILVKSSIFFIGDVNYLFVVLLLTNLTNNIVYNAISIYLNEMVNSDKRGLFFCIFNSLYGISGIIFTIIFNLSFSWKILQMVSVFASVISLLINIFFFSESIRYLFMQKKNTQILETLNYIAKINGRTSEYESWLNIQKLNQADNLLTEENQKFENTSNPIVKIFSNKRVVYDFLTFCLISLVIISGIIYNAVEIKMTKDTFLYPIIFYFMDFIVIFITGFIIEIPALGRKLPAIFFSVLAAIFYSMKYVDILNNPTSSRFWLDFLIRQSVGISFNILMEYNFEIYSTDIRSTAFNINKLFSRVGDFFTPLLLAKNRGLCTITLSVGYLVISLLTLNLVEPKGHILKEKVEEYELSNKMVEKDRSCSNDEEKKGLKQN